MLKQMVITGSLAEKSFAALNAAQTGPYKHNRTWFLLADARHAMLLTREDGGLKRLGDMRAHMEYENAIGDHNFGQIPQSEKSLEHEDLVFARTLAEWLNKACDEHAFDSLVIAASPKTLGRLRGLLSAQVQDKVIAELNKDLINLPTPQIERALSHIAYF